MAEQIIILIPVYNDEKSVNNLLNELSVSLKGSAIIISAEVCFFAAFAV